MDIEQKVVKDEIDIHEDFVWNMDVKQELSDDVPKATFQNVNTNNVHSIKQEVNEDLNSFKIFGECMIAAKTERDSSQKVNLPNIGNKFKYSKRKLGRRTKSKANVSNNGNEHIESEESESKEVSDFDDNSVDDSNYEISSNDDSYSSTQEDNFDPNISLSPSKNVSKSHLEDIEPQLSTSITQPGACNDNDMKVMESRGKKGDKKANFCIYCYSKQQKIARHLLTKHRSEESIQKILLLPKGSSERKQLIGNIRKKGNFLFNTNQQFNDGELIVSRRPRKHLTKGAPDFRACANCKGFYSKRTLKVHFNLCTGFRYKNSRVATILSKKLTGRMHSAASHEVQNHLFPPLRDDDVSNAIKYDELIVIFANNMVEKYREHRHFQMIRQRLRLIGKFLINMKKRNSNILNMTSVYDPAFVDDALVAINICAGYNENINAYQVPSVAFNLGTLLKQMGDILTIQSIKKHDDVTKKNAKEFLKVFKHSVGINVNRTVAETQLKMRRKKKVILPSIDDIRKLREFLNHERNIALLDCKQMEQPIEKESWMKLAELTLTSVQLFNRRRADEIERITIEDFETFQTVEQSNVDLFKSLSETSKQIAKKYVRFTIRGKLNRTVPVLLDSSLLECIKSILQFRSRMGVSKHNPYIFGLPGGDKKRFPHLNACSLMRKSSIMCGAQDAKRLRGTNLRKHIATTCITLNLQDQEIYDLSNFMGHSEKIHKGIYQQPVLSRDVLGISKLLEVAQGVGIDDGSDEDCEDEISDTNEKEPDENKDINIINCSRFSQKASGKSNRVRWTTDEKNAVFRIFKENFKQKVLPSLKFIQEVIKNTAVLQNRTSPQIKTYIHNTFKSKRKL